MNAFLMMLSQCRMFNATCKCMEHFLSLGNAMRTWHPTVEISAYNTNQANYSSATRATRQLKGQHGGLLQA